MRTRNFVAQGLQQCGLLIAFSLFYSQAIVAQDLLESYTQALQSAPELKAAEARLQAATSKEEQNRALRYPSVNLNGNVVRDRQETLSSNSLFFAPRTPYFTTKSAAIRASQPIYQPANHLRLKIAQQETSNTQNLLKSTQQQLIFNITQRYFNILLAQDNLDFSRAEKEAIGEQLKLAQQGFELGATAITDKLEAQARFDLASANLIRTEIAFSNAKLALAELTGTTVNNLNKLNSIPINSTLTQNEADWVELATANNLTLQSSRTALTQAQQAIKLNRTGHLPTLSLTASHQYNETSGGNFGDRATTDSTIGVEFNVPLFKGGQVSAQVREAAERQTQTAFEYEQQRRQIIRQTHEDFRLWQSSKKMIEAFQQAVISNKTALKAAQAGLEVGTRTMIDVLNAQQTLFRSKRDFSQARYDYILAGLKLKLTSGKLSREDLIQINNLLTN